MKTQLRPILTKLVAILKKNRECSIPDPSSSPSPFWQTAAVRHLAWLCRAPSLTTTPLDFDLAHYLPDDLDLRLAALDRNPAPLLQVLADNPSSRLGFYFEGLYHFLLTDILGWPLLLKNSQVRREGRTLGELDFIIHNPVDDRIEHHEIAVKFYLGFPSADATATLWYGPNANDRLDIKTRRLINHQCALTRRPETRELLQSHGITSAPEPRLFMPGYLFYPVQTDLAPPSHSPANHARGRWCRIESLNRATTQYWDCLVKPHWLGPLQSVQAPDHARTSGALDDIAAGGAPRLFAVMAPRGRGDGWEEVDRYFVVPARWPDVSP